MQPRVNARYNWYVEVNIQHTVQYNQCTAAGACVFVE